MSAHPRHGGVGWPASGVGNPKLERIATWIFAVYWVALVAALGAIWTHFPDLHHGDSFSDANVLNAGRNFDRVGLRPTGGLPVWWSSIEPDRTPRIYSHYPPGPEWIHQGLKGLGLTALWQFRMVSVLVAGAALLAAWAVGSLVSGTRVVGTLFAVFYSWSVPFTSYADSLHEHAYEQLTLMVCLSAWLAYERSPQRAIRRRWLALAGLAVFLDLWLTFEHILLIPLFVGVSAVRSCLRRRILAALVLGAVMIGALGSRVLHNGVVMGGLRPAFDDLIVAAKYRAVSDTLGSSIEKVASTWQARLGGGARMRDDFEMEFVYPVLKPEIFVPAALLLGLLITELRRSQPAARRSVASGLLLLIGGVAWFVAMKEHADRHRHLVMLLMPGFAMILAGLTAGGLLGGGWQGRRWPLRACGASLSVILLGTFLQDMCHSRTLNFVAPLNPNVHRLVMRHVDELASVKRAAAGDLTPLRKLWFAGRAWSELAYTAGRPYEFVESEVPFPLPVTDGVWIEPWTAEENELAWTAIQHIGYPRMVAPNRMFSYVFAPDWGAANGTDIRIDTRLTLSAIRVAPTIDGRGSVVQTAFRFQGAPNESINGIHQETELLDGDGNVLTGTSFELRRDSIAHEGALFANRCFDSATMIGARFVRIRFRDADGHSLSCARDNSTLSAPLRLEVDGPGVIYELMPEKRAE